MKKKERRWNCSFIFCASVVMAVMTFQTSHKLLQSTNIGENGLWKDIPEGINQTFFNSLVVNNNGESTLHTINKYKEIELPILVVGMPKVGTTSITEFFKCSGRYKVSHHQCKGRGGHGRCGVLIRDNVLEGRPPLQATGDFDVYAQMDAFALSAKYFDYKCYMPQVEILNELHAHYPNATLILNTRNVTNWIKSLHNYNSGNMLKRLVQCNITGLPNGVGNNDSDLYTFFQNHLDRIRSFVKTHQSHKLIEFNIESHDAGNILGDAFGINHTCWGQANKSK